MMVKTALEFFMNYGGIAGPLSLLALEKPSRGQLDGAVATALRKGQPEALCTEAAATIAEKIGIRDEHQHIGMSHRMAMNRKQIDERSYDHPIGSRRTPQ